MFDVDKVFISMKYYRRGEDKKLTDVYDRGSIEAETNTLIDDYLALLKDTDRNNVVRLLHKLHASIDTDTKELKALAKEVDSDVKSGQYSAYDAYSMHSHILSKEELIGGKAGIGPYALNNNNQILTMLYGVEFARGNNIMTRLGLNSLHNANDRDGRSILSWISGLINAHVDIAKDPWISKLNVNKATHNMVNLLVRTGLGDTAFYFIAQPIIKRLAKAHMNALGIYGIDKNKSNYQNQKEAEAKLIVSYINENLGTEFTDKELKKALEYFKNYFKDRYNRNVDAEITTLFSKQDTRLHEGFKNNTNTTFDTQMLCYIAWTLFEEYAKALSDLVKYSKIDTKKLGKNIIELTQYYNGYRNVFENTQSKTHKLFEHSGLTRMATFSYIESKTKNALNAFTEILDSELFLATRLFRSHINDILNVTGNSGTTSLDIIKLVSNGIVGKIKSEYFFGKDGYCEQNGINAKELINGKNSIYNKLLNIKIQIQRGTNYKDLRDVSGEPTNFLLRWLTTAYTYQGVQLPHGTKPDSYGQAKFVKMFNFLEDENIDQDEIVAAWEELLNDGTHPELQLFAKELIVYAFMTSADNGGGKDLFKYVPNSWKTDTDGNGYSRSYVKYVYDQLQAYQNNSKILSESEIDDIVLNTWYDNSLVKYTKLHDEDIPFRFSKTSNNGNPHAFIRTYSEKEDYSNYLKIRNASVQDGESLRQYTIYKAIKILNWDNGTVQVLYAQVDARGSKFKTGDIVYEYGLYNDQYNQFYIDAAAIGFVIPDITMNVARFLNKYVEKNTDIEKEVKPWFLKLGIEFEPFSAMINFLRSGVADPYRENLDSWSEQDAVSVTGPVTTHNGMWTRNEALNNPDILYVFTDNTDRDSGSGPIDDRSWYAQKYGKGHHYPTQTQAVVRGLDNARPISTLRWYHKGAKGKAGQWTDADYSEFVKVIDAEIEDIKQAWLTGRFKQIMFGPGDAIFNGQISEITEQRVPLLYTYLQFKMSELTMFVNNNIPNKTPAPNTYATPAIDIQSISSKTEDYGVEVSNGSEDFWNKIRSGWQQSNSNGIVAYRKYGSDPRSFTAETVNQGWIGNPFSIGDMSPNTVNKFYEWLVYGTNFNNQFATEEFRQAIVNKILTTPEGSPVLYYTELNRPSHATVIGYLVNNKQLFTTPASAQGTTEQNVQPVQENTHPFAWVQGENISSTGSEFAKMLTNPGNNLQVEYKGKVFRNAEHAYQTWKSGQFDEAAYNSTEFIPRGTKPVNKATSFLTMVDILTAKLRLHPELVQGITDRGGIFYLLRSTHNVKGDKFWESSGQNGFMRALSKAYDTVIQESPSPFDDPNEFSNEEMNHCKH